MILCVPVLAVGLMLGCNGGNEPAKQTTSPAPAAQKPAEQKPAEQKPSQPAAQAPAAPVVEYHEFEHHGRIYVAGSKKSADAVKGGGEFQQSITRIGEGPGGKTVVFEANKDKIEQVLMAEFAKRHGK
jgi:predicted ATP-dependent serine protease